MGHLRDIGSGKTYYYKIQLGVRKKLKKKGDSAYYYWQVEALYVSFWHATCIKSGSNRFFSPSYSKGKL